LRCSVCTPGLRWCQLPTQTRLLSVHRARVTVQGVTWYPATRWQMKHLFAAWHPREAGTCDLARRAQTAASILHTPYRVALHSRVERRASTVVQRHADRFSWKNPRLYKYHSRALSRRYFAAHMYVFASTPSMHGQISRVLP
jgi:hypothetical protein